MAASCERRAESFRWDQYTPGRWGVEQTGLDTHVVRHNRRALRIRATKVPRVCGLRKGARPRSTPHRPPPGRNRPIRQPPFLRPDSPLSLSRPDVRPARLLSRLAPPTPSVKSTGPTKRHSRSDLYSCRRPLMVFHPVLKLHFLGFTASVQRRCPERAIGLPRTGAASFVRTGNKSQKG